MDQIRKFLPFFKSRSNEEKERSSHLSFAQKKKKERSSHFCKNGSLVMEELISSFGGRYKLPLRSFTAKELIRASNNFSEKVHHMTENGNIFRGNLDGRPVLLKFYTDFDYFSNGMSENRVCQAIHEVVVTSHMSHLKNVSKKYYTDFDYYSSNWMSESRLYQAIRDVVVTSQMSHLKNVLKLIGCSLELKYPAMVYEFAGTDLLPKYLSYKHDSELLSWKSRIKIAKDIANVIAQLHTAFPTPIIYRDLTANNVIIDQCGVAKLFNFTLSLYLPPGELQVEDRVRGTIGYLDPQYNKSGFVTQKTDVYSFGVLMLVLVNGETNTFKHREGTDEPLTMREYAKSCIENDQFDKIVDPMFFEDEGNNELKQNLLAFLDLALRCTEYEGLDRPDMIDVAKELLQIEKSVRCH